MNEDQLNNQIDAFFDAARPLAKALVARWLASLEARDQAEAAAPIGTPAQSDRPLNLGEKRELTVMELAALWGVSKRSIYQWKTTGELPFKKMGRLLCFDLIEADQWRTKHRESFNKGRLRVVK
jgi:excisionase family DNA binding protein